MAKSEKIQKLKRCFLVAISWQVIVLLLVIVAQFISQKEFSLDYLFSWDGGWYLSILNGAYHNPTNPASVFYPLLPLIVKLLQIATFGLLPLPMIILLVNTISLAIAIFYLYEISLVFLKKISSAKLVVLLFLTFPTAFFMGQFYTEALFCALSFAAYYFALTKQWPKMAVALAFLTATRLPGVLIILLCGLEYLNQHQWQLKKAFNKNLSWFLLAPLGFLAYGFYLLVVRGNFFGMFSAYDLTNDWIYHKFDPLFFKTLAKELIIVLTNPFFTNRLSWGDYIVNHLMPFLSLVLLAAASIYAIKKFKQKGYALGFAGLASIVFFTLNSNIVSVHRYVLPNLVIFIGIAHFISTKLISRLQKFTIATWLIGGFTAQAILIYLFINLKFIG